MSLSSLARTGSSAARKCLLGILLSCFSGLALAEPLDVISVENAVEFRNGSSGWVALNPGSQLQPPVEIQTSKDATVVLQQAGSTFILKPETRLSFSGNSNSGDGLVSKIKHWIGTAFYRIERQPDTLSVETPFLVSTIKGTQFVIVSTKQDSFITLTEGALQVEDLMTGQKVMIRPGEILGSSANGQSTHNRQPGRAAPAEVENYDAKYDSERPQQAVGETPRFGAGDASRKDANLVRGANGFERALEAIDEVRIDQRENSERRGNILRGRPEVDGKAGGAKGPGPDSKNGDSNGNSGPGLPSGPKPGPGMGGGDDMPGAGLGSENGSGESDDDDDDGEED